MYKIVPTYKNGKWIETKFEELKDFKNFIEPIFKVPGEYDFDKIALLFNQEAKIFNNKGFYCNKPFRSKDFNTYWEDQKKKCRDGVIYHGKENIFYLKQQVSKIK